MRAKIGRSWARRAISELSTANSCAVLVHGLLENGASAEVLRIAAKAVSDEVRHAQLCQDLAEQYLEQRLEPPRARSVETPHFGAAPEPIRRLLLVVHHACIGEAIASVFLQENLRLAEEPAVRSTVHALLRDTLEHARLGWAHLGSAWVDDTARAHVAAALPALLRLAVQSWLARSAEDDFDCPGHGVLAHSRFRPILRDALENLVLPSFDPIGIATDPARAWLEAEPLPA